MSEPETFLARWTRLKREAAEAAEAAETAETPEQAQPDAAAEASRPAEPADAAAPQPPAEPAFDISTLPPIDSITATTDIRAFLAPGVPPELARAALRRAWVADPAIRDFVGIAENQFDFNDPNAIPGFGSLGPLDDVRRLVAQVIGGVPIDQTEGAAAVTEQISAAEGQNSGFIADKPQESGATQGHLPELENARQPDTALADVQRSKLDAASPVEQTEDDERSRAELPTRRTHGRALPT